jgi:asparagine synthetase B (glutamine-hydrolysing)
LAADCQLEEGWMSSGIEGRQILQGTAGDPFAALEVLLREYGVEGLNQVRGYFSLAYWDERDRALLLGCDHVGYKSLYYAQLADRLAFARS